MYFDQIHPNPSQVHSTSLTHFQFCHPLCLITHQILFIRPTYSWAQGYPLKDGQPTWEHTLKKRERRPTLPLPEATNYQQLLSEGWGLVLEC